MATDPKTITRFEELSLNAWPSLRVMLYDGWILRFSNGYTKRANSSNPLYPGTLDIGQKIRVCENIFTEAKLDTIFKITEETQPSHLDAMLESAGYVVEAQSFVQTLQLERISRSAADNDYYGIVLSQEPTSKWFSAFFRMSGLADEMRETAKQMLLNTVPQKRLASIRSAEGEIVACGMAVLQGEYVGLFDIMTDKNFRRRGYASRLTMSLLEWAKANGAKTAYLQVVANNKPAIELYSRLGFIQSYRYWYRIKNNRD